MKIDPNKIFNSALGILIIPLMSLLLNLTTYSIALEITILACLFGYAISKAVFRIIEPYMLITSTAVIFIHAILYYLTSVKNIPVYYQPIVFEIIFVIYSGLVVLMEGKFKKLALNKGPKQTEKNVIIAQYLDEYYYVLHIYLNVIICHLLCVLIYKLLPSYYHNYKLNDIIYLYSLPILIFLVIAFEYIRILMLQRRINAEQWLPVINEKGSVIGKIAKTVSFSSGNKYMHPVIRIVLLYKGMFFLRERPDYYLIDPGKVDYPFEEYTLYEQKLQMGIDDLIEKRGGVKGLPTKFAFRYVFKNEITNRLIYLYISQIPDEKKIETIKETGGGKLWTSKQIEENLEKGIFSNLFEKEYEILKSTILMVEKYSLRL